MTLFKAKKRSKKVGVNFDSFCELCCDLERINFHNLNTLELKQLNLFYTVLNYDSLFCVAPLSEDIVYLATHN